jgi:ABC-type nitrate/sulfonate/bicarbonate transport system substrate-binding protein
MMMRKWFKKMVSLLVVSSMVFALAACGGKETTNSGEDTKETSDSGSANMSLKIISTPDAQSGAQITIAKEMGYFEEEGLDVDIQYVTTLSDMASIIGGGGCDVAFNSLYSPYLAGCGYGCQNHCGKQ